MRKNRNRRIDMNKTFALLAALAAGMPAAALARTVQGVDWDAVPWATFCPSVKPVELRTDAGACTVSHPASQKHAAWSSFGMETKQPPPNCKHAEPSTLSGMAPPSAKNWDPPPGSAPPVLNEMIHLDRRQICA
jgi:hypothetical protein